MHIPNHQVQAQLVPPPQHQFVLTLPKSEATNSAHSPPPSPQPAAYMCLNACHSPAHRPVACERLAGARGETHPPALQPSILPKRTALAVWVWLDRQTTRRRARTSGVSNNRGLIPAASYYACNAKAEHTSGLLRRCVADGWVGERAVGKGWLG